ncbi:Vesicle-associated membrane protein [Metarhizium album ARSEF 1941]|uniref:Vesicle-associated membrane protein n=1 Tax=Metarhizium album (strain ARSEF 1941) TaxID=1081103 RepID=A0A0B2WLI3_METAS|nr:Vesicle-associated membrane protein [Metarhizium album ARSEF 1941]KHN93880.1 Vesicle-associated membrane protein [Metarhizium album ARSEF 1941]
MTVDILPLELNFTRPFTIEVSRTLTIRNTSSSPLAFKVKTTAPKQYCVRPNAGRIEPGSAFDVTVLLQAMKQDPPLDAKCRDKFLVQCAPITSDKDFSSIASVLESADRATLVERKIRVNWLAANGEDAQGPAASALSTPSKPSAVNGATETPDAPRTFSSPGDDAHSTTIAAPPPYTPDDAAAEETDDKLERPKSAVSHAATSVSETAQATYEELKSKLAPAEAQLLNLKDSGLRQRNVKNASSDEKRPAAITAQLVRQQPGGVPVPVVALLCLLSFLLAYLFF